MTDATWIPVGSLPVGAKFSYGLGVNTRLPDDPKYPGLVLVKHSGLYGMIGYNPDELVPKPTEVPHER